MTEFVENTTRRVPNKEHLILWYQALMSGDYVQGDGRLCAVGHDGEPDKWCCLGVACDVAVKNGVEMLLDADGIRKYFDGMIAYLPKKVEEWLGVPDHDPDLAGERASNWNDSSRLSFPEIAELIKNEYELAV
jgi:hypothetical protein